MDLKRAVSWQWLFQVLMYASGGAMFLLAPRFTLVFLRAKGFGDFDWPNWDAQPQIAVDLIRMIGAWIVPAGLVSSLGILREEPDFRRRLARIIALFITWWSVAYWFNTSTGRYGVFALVAFGITGFETVIANWAFTFNLHEDEDVSIDLGSADGRPPLLWVVWFIQFLGFGLLAVGHAFFPMTLLGWLSDGAAFARMPEAAKILAVDQMRILSGYILLVSMLSAFALAQDRLPVWRAFRHIFAATMFTWTAVLMIGMATGSYDVVSGFVGILVSVGLGVANLAIGSEESKVTDDDDIEDLEYWTLLDLTAGPFMMIQSMATRRRASHLMGVGARGSVVVQTHADVPRNRVFQNGRRFEVTARFANLSELDDAALDVRGAALSLVEGEQRVDLLMNTGSFSAAADMASFATLVASKFLPESGTKAAIRANPSLLEGAVAGLRRAPESYARLYFYSQKVTYWVDDQGERWLVRYRLAPADLGPESGVPDDDDAAAVWNRSRLGSETRVSNYLREELKRRASGEGVHMRLQAQWHEENPGDTLDWYSPGLDWDSEEHPWLDLGAVTLNAEMSDEDTERLFFNPGNTPRSLGTPAASGMRDPRSVADSERRVVWRLGKIRKALYAAFGLPKLGDVWKKKG